MVPLAGYSEVGLRQDSSSAGCRINHATYHEASCSPSSQLTIAPRDRKDTVLICFPLHGMLAFVVSFLNGDPIPDPRYLQSCRVSRPTRGLPYPRVRP
jgi:hypothetical protein